MESSSIQEKALNFLKRNILLSALFFGGLIFLSIGLIQFSGKQSNEIQFSNGVDVAGASTSATISVGQKIMVDVSGQVVNPGVYKLDSNARIQDALAAAGGLSADADRDFVSKAVNLAGKLNDGAKIYIPKVGESASLSSVGNSISTTGGLISINSAQESQLESLPGVGPTTAGKIINGRPYSSLDELLNKKVVSKSTYGKIKDLISL